ncbi:MAG TPA: ABC transporter substrate-binding protein [Acidimicrobiales bacterium]|nr:ABC transporter substrate-binding protein [Acidimicrobiales bacterium]
MGLAVGTAAVLALAGCGSSSHSNAGSGSTGGSSGGSGGGSKSPIVIGYISNLTGVASSTFADGPGGAQAVIDQVNSQGGVNGHPLRLVVKDDASSVNGDQTAAQELVQNDHATVVIMYSSFGFAGAPLLQKAGIPVVGSAFDGPEWGNAPYSNMFTWQSPASSPFQGKLYTWTNLGKFLKAQGVTSFGGLGYGISPSSTNSILAAEASAKSQGISTCYTNNSVNFGAVDFTADVLQIKQANCGAIAGSFVSASDLALSKAIKQAGLSNIKQIFFTGYDEHTTAQPADAQGFDGDFAQASVTFSPPNAGGQALLDLLKKYDKSYDGGLPDFGLLGSTVSAQLAVYGLQQAGSNPTASSFISALRKVSNWTDNGLFQDTPVDFTHFGTEAQFPATACTYYEQLVNGQWKTYNNGPVCGDRITLPAKG